MATPSRAEIEDQLGKVINLFEEARQFAEVNATDNWVALEDLAVQSQESDFASETLAGVSSSRAFLDALLRNASVAMTPGFQSYAKFLDSENITDIDVILDRLFQDYVDNTQRVTSRQFTFGSPAAAGGNVGDGLITRLNIDKEGFDIENQHADAKEAICVIDQNSGANKHEEEFEFRSQDPGKDALQVSGSGLLLPIRALSARDSLLGNPSFSQFGGTIAAPTSITNWTSDVTVNGTNYSIDQTNFFRDFVGDTTPSALNIKVSANLTQKLSVRRTALDPDTPYLLQLVFNRTVGTASGTLTVKMGTASTVVVVAAQVGFTIVQVPLTPGSNNWVKNFNEDDLDIEIDWVRTAGELLIDDVLLVAGTSFDNSWYWIIGGATPFLLEDEFTWTDTEVGSIVQRWIWRGFDRYLPSTTGGGVTWPEP